MKPVQSLVVGVLLTVAPVVAHAQTAYPECTTTDPSSEEVEAAKGAFTAGKAAFDEADYEKAITYWRDAYRRDCRAHDLLQNLARAYELGNQKEEAIHALETYLKRVPDTGQRDQFQRRIDKLKEQVAAEAAAPSQPASEDPKPPPTVAVDTKPPPPVAGKKPLTPMVLVGAGAATAGVGLVGFLVASGDVKSYEDQCGEDRGDCPSKEVFDQAQAARDRQVAFGIVGWAGLGLTAGGAVWYLVAPRKPTKAARSLVTPVVTPGTAGLQVSGRF